MKVEQIAAICHEANRALCESDGDFTQAPWHQAPAWQRESALKGVQFCLDNPDLGPEGQHEAWMKDKLVNGWRLAREKNERLKTHPCLIPFAQLPPIQQAKDRLFRAVVLALK